MHVYCITPVYSSSDMLGSTATTGVTSSLGQYGLVSSSERTTSLRVFRMKCSFKSIFARSSALRENSIWARIQQPVWMLVGDDVFAHAVMQVSGCVTRIHAEPESQRRRCRILWHRVRTQGMA